MGTPTADRAALALATDTELAGLYAEAQGINHQLASCVDTLHYANGERKQFSGRRYNWPTSTAAVIVACTQRVIDGRDNDLSIGRGKIAATLAQINELKGRLAAIRTREAELDAIYQAAPWQRYFPCMNTDGHIHATLTGCPSVRFDTAMGWYPELSGHTVAEAITELGTRICSKCFPDAPAEHCNGTWKRDEAARTGREQAAADRARVKAAKNLTAEQAAYVGRTGHGDRVTTVAGALTAIRDAVMFANYRGLGGRHSYADAAEACATRCREVLIERGAHTAAQLDEVAAKKLKAWRKEMGF